MNLIKILLPFVALANASTNFTTTIPIAIHETSQTMNILTYTPLIEEETIPIDKSSLYVVEPPINDFRANLTPLFMNIAIAESGLNPKAYNPEWHYKNGEKYCQGSYGLLQIACINYDGDPKDLYNPEVNIEVANRILSEQGVFAWGVCHGKIECI